ncbi:MAG: GMC family oxidoreductase [Alphaproteobacteria bacterium]|nr:GMC family oxidoreductase [Alphaproteobacteria bacterium]
MDRDVAAITFDHDDDTVVVVIGSGAGGGTLANELSQKGINVVVLEAGPRIEMDQFVNDEQVMGDLLLWKDPRRAVGTRESARTFPETPSWMCKAVGGTTVHWTGTCPRIKDTEFKARTTYGDIPGSTLLDWPISLADVEPYYDRAETKMGVAGTGGRPWLPGNNNYKVMAAAARRLGYTEFHTGTHAINAVPYDGRNACDQIGFCMQGCKSGAKWSTLYTEIPKAEATGRCEVRPQCHALQIHHDADGRVTGVLYADRTGQRQFQKARIVSVAGNSIETPRLLLNSASARFPDGLANSAGHVGHHYCTHVDAAVYGIFEKPVNWHRGRIVSGTIRDESYFNPKRGFVGGYYFLTIALGLRDYALALRPKGWGRDYTEWLDAYDHTAGIYFVGEDMPLRNNRVYLHPTEKDRYGMPIPVCHLDNHQNDIVLRNHGLKQCTALLDAAGAKRLHEWTAFAPGHNLGTCRMSERPADGVVNKWGQSHDTPNLFVSDGSQFTTSAAANPTLTIVALAIRQAEYIAEAMRRNDV